MGAKRENKDDRTSRFSGRLRELREAAGLSRQELADKAGMKLGGVRNLEQGTRDPGWDTVLVLAQALGVTCEAFTAEPAPASAPTAGRPRKPPVEDAEPLQPKKPRGRPRKPPAVAQGGQSTAEPVSEPSGPKKPAAGQGRKKKGKGTD